jgi:hypothetical protein
MNADDWRSRALPRVEIDGLAASLDLFGVARGDGS